MTWIRNDEALLNDLMETRGLTFVDVLGQLDPKRLTGGWWVWDIPRKLEYYSPLFLNLLGFEEEEIQGIPDTWKELIFEADKDTAFGNYEKHIETHGVHPYSQIVRYRTKRGNVVRVLCEGKVLRWGPSWEPLIMVGKHIDLTPLNGDLQKQKKGMDDELAP